MGLSVVILAGGEGTRMRSKTPKVLHPLAGKPLLAHVIDTVQGLQAEQIIVVRGHMGDHVKSVMDGYDITWVEQRERLGTGHAVQQTLPHLNTANQVLILYGDVPLIGLETLSHLVDSTGPGQLGLLTAVVKDPTGLGRIVRDEYRQVHNIIEEKDASDLEKQIKEINTGIYCVPGHLLKTWLPKLNNHNAQQEYYLTDIVGFAREDQVGVNVSKPKAIEEIYGANSRAELAKMEAIYQRWQAETLMASGVTLMDPARVDVRGQVTPARDCIIDVNVVLEGDVQLAEDCYIGPFCTLKNVILAPGAVVNSHCVLEDCVVGENAEVGPFARIRPGTQLDTATKVGNFVEIKNAQLGSGTKVNHLSYIGDAQIGASVNVGAGVITCNYDGANKHQTIIESGAFIGSDCQLVAPVTVGKNATVGAGSTITKSVTDGHLALSRVKQTEIADWQRPQKATCEEVE